MIENKITSHVQAWCNIMHADDRVYSAFQSSNNEVPPLYGLRKDHKSYTDETEGLPNRPVCGAITSCNYRFLYFMSTKLKPYIQLAEEICDSTEDMLSCIEQCNIKMELTNCTVGSFDVDALCPSTDFSVEKCLELIFQSEITFHVDYAEVGLYLSLTLDPKALREEGIYDYCPTQKICGRPPTITSIGKGKYGQKGGRTGRNPKRLLILAQKESC